MRKSICALLFFASCSDPTVPPDPSITWLLSMQSPDGAWRSVTYDKILGEGLALTPLVLLAADLPIKTREKAIQFLSKNIGQTKEYPTYSAALTLLALKEHRPKGWKESVDKLVRFLRNHQLTEKWGWRELNPEYGAWDSGRGTPRYPHTDRPDLSVTAFAAEALRAAEVPADDPTLQRALKFALRCRNEDGGFFFTAHKRSTFQNKAGERRSYGTATCDGLRILKAAGLPENDPITKEAKAWLEAHSPVHVPGGFPGNQNEPWAESLSYYYYFTQSLVRPSAHLNKLLLSLRKKDGSWVNVYGLMKEDDPILVTALTLLSLKNLRNP